MFKKEHNYVHVVIECPPNSKVVRIFLFCVLLKSQYQRKLHVQSFGFVYDTFYLGKFHIGWTVGTLRCHKNMMKSSSLFDVYQVQFKRTRRYSQIHLALSENMNCINMFHLVFYLDYIHIPDIITLYIFLEVFLTICTLIL